MWRTLRRIGRIAAWIVLAALALAVTAALTLLLWARSPPGRQRLLATIVRLAQAHLPGTLTMGRLEGDLVREIVLRDVRLTDGEGQLAVRIDALTARYSLFELVRAPRRISEVHVAGAHVHARVMRDGRLNLSRPANAPAQPVAPGGRSEVIVERLSGEALLEYDRGDGRERWRGQLRLDAAAGVAGEQVHLQLTSAMLAVQTPLPLTIQARGGALLAPAAVTLRAVRVTARTPPEEPPAIDAELRAEGTERGMRFELRGTVAGGAVEADAEARLPRPRTVVWTARASARELDPATLRRNAPHGRIALSVHGQGENGAGSVTLEALVAEVAGTRAQAHGVVGLGGAATTIDAAAEVRSPDLSRLAPLGLPGLRGSLVARAHVVRGRTPLAIDADVDGHDLAIAGVRAARLEAKVHAAGLQGSATVRAEAVHLPRAGGLHFDRVKLDARGEQHQLTFDLDASGPHGTIARLRTHGEPLRDGSRSAELTIDRLVLGARGQRWQAIRPGRLRVDARTVVASLAASPGGDEWLTIDGRMDRHGGPIDLRVQGRALDVRGLAALARPDLDVPSSRLELAAHVAGTLEQPTIDATLRGHTMPWPERALPAIELAVYAHQKQRRVRATLDATAIGSQVSARVDMPVPVEDHQPVSADLDSPEIDLALLHGWLPPELASLRGRVRLTAAVRGTARAPEVTAQLDAPAWSLADLGHGRSALQLDYRGTRLDAHLDTELRPESEAPGAIVVTLRAPIDLPSALRSRRYLAALQHTRPFVLDARAQRLDLARLPLRRLGWATALVGGRVDEAVLDVRGTLHDPVAVAHVEGYALLTDKAARVDVGLRASYGAGRGHAELHTRLRRAPILDAHAQSTIDAQRLVDGLLRWKDVPLTIDATIPSYELSGLSDLVDVAPLTGVLSGEVAMGGSLANPTGTVTLHAQRLQLGELRLSTVGVRAQLEAGGLLATADAAGLPSGALHMTARVPRSAGEPLAVTLRADRLALALPRAGRVRALSGTLDADLRVGGTPAAPIVNGRLELHHGAFAIAGEPRRYEDLLVHVTAQDNRIVLHELSVRLGSGSLSANGTLTLAGRRPRDVQLQAEAKRFPFQRRNLGAWVDARVQLHGRMEGETMRGELTLSRGTAHLPRLSSARPLQTIGPLEDVAFSDEEAAAAGGATGRATTAEAPPTVDLVAHIPGPFRVRSPQLRLDLQGQVEVLLVGGAPQLFGHVESTGGEVELLGRRYEIEWARLAFGQEGDANPTLDVRITRRVDNTSVVVEVHGTAKEPKLELTSDPPGQDPSQLIGMIISGNPSDPRIEPRSTEEAVAGALSGLLVDRIREQIVPGLPIDVLRVERGVDSGFAGVGGTRIEIGKYLTDRVYLSYGHRFGAPSGKSNANVSEARLEYRFRRHYRLATRFGGAGIANIAVEWSVRF